MKNMNYFELFKLPVKYQLDANELDHRFEYFATLCHPDRVAALSAFEKKQYMQMFTTLNEAYQTLKDPVTRAEYFLILNNIEYHTEKTFQNDMELLETQMLFREKIQDSQTLSELSDIISEIRLNLSELFNEIPNNIDQKNWNNVIELIDKIKFFNKLYVAAQQKKSTLEKE